MLLINKWLVLKLILLYIHRSCECYSTWLLVSTLNTMWLRLVRSLQPLQIPGLTVIDECTMKWADGSRINIIFNDQRSVFAVLDMFT